MSEDTSLLIRKYPVEKTLLYRRASLMETVPLTSIYLHVTKECNLHCCYCYFSATRPLPDEMTTEEFSQLWPDMVALRPQKVVLTGGEPLLRMDIMDQIRSLRDADPDHHVLRCLNTNGHLMTPELARNLVGMVDEVRVSVDALPERNDSLRGRGSFESAMKALDDLHAVGFEPKALVTVTSISLPDLEGLMCFLVEKGITHINLHRFRPIGRGKRYLEWQTSPSEYRSTVHRAWQRYCPDQPVPPEPRDTGVHSHCGVGFFLNIMPNGDVFPCHVLTNPEFHCGNVRETSLFDICRRDGFLGKLQSLDFSELSRQDKRLAALIELDTCMGTIYFKTRSLQVWRDNIL